MNTLLDPYFYAYNPELLAFENAWVNFIKNGQINSSVIKPDVLDSWLRCKNNGMDPVKANTLPLISSREISERLHDNADLMKIIVPYMEYLFEIVRGDGFVINFVDSDGYILKQIADEDAYEICKKSSSLPGANRLEEYAGTNAIALAFITKKPIQIAGSEHYLQELHRWTCSAAPVLDDDKNVICAISVAGRYEMIHSHTLGMVAAVSKAIENEIRIQSINSELTRSYEQLQTTFEMVTDGLLYIEDGIVVQCNSSMCDLVGKPAEEIIGRPLAECIKTNPAIDTIIDKGQMDSGNVKVSIANGQQSKSCFLDVRPIFSGRGRDVKVAVFRLVSELRKLASKITNQTRYTFDDILGNSQKLKSAIDIAKRAAAHDVRVVLEGESGTGKEMFAQAIHNESDRREAPFIAIDCGAVPVELLESNLFGYEGGSFTGAKKEGRAGVFEQANGGTILLDEIENMNLEMQQKLLRALEENAVTRIGGSKQIPFDVRIIAASNASLAQRVEEKTFREDLYYRIGVMNIKIPSLRERREDIPLLVEHFLSKDTPITKKKHMDEDAMNKLVNYSWPGNIRQLINAIEYAKIMTNAQEIHAEDLPLTMQPADAKGAKGKERHFESLKSITYRYVNEVIKANDNNISKAARVLGISRATIYNIMKGGQA